MKTGWFKNHQKFYLFVMFNKKRTFCIDRENFEFFLLSSSFFEFFEFFLRCKFFYLRTQWPTLNYRKKKSWNSFSWDTSYSRKVSNCDSIELEIYLDHKFQWPQEGQSFKSLAYEVVTLWPGGLGNYFVSKKFAGLTLLWPLEFVIQINLVHDTIPIFSCLQLCEKLNNKILYFRWTFEGNFSYSKVILTIVLKI